MGCIVTLGWEESSQVLVGLLDGHIGGEKPYPSGYAEDMRIHRKGGFPQGKQQNNGGSFWAYSFEFNQPGVGFIHWKVSEKLDS